MTSYYRTPIRLLQILSLFLFCAFVFSYLKDDFGVNNRSLTLKPSTPDHLFVERLVDPFSEEHKRLWKNAHKGFVIHNDYFALNQQNYENFWDRGTFPTVHASITYHTRKHGMGRTPLKYTSDAVHFYQQNKPIRYRTILKDGSQGYRIRKGQQGGIWTKDGKILTYWD